MATLSGEKKNNLEKKILKYILLVILEQEVQKENWGKKGEKSDIYIYIYICRMSAIREPKG